MAEKQRYKIVELPNVPEQYANQFVSGGFDGSAISINLGTARLVPERMGDLPKDGAVPVVYVTTKLMMSVPAAMEMVKQLSGMMDQIGIKSAPTGQSAPPPPSSGWIDSDKPN